MMSLTTRQQDTLRFIIGYQERNGIGPLISEIVAGIGLSPHSLYAVVWLLRALEERGAVARFGSHWRSIVVLRPIAIPRAPDGEPLHFIRIGGQG